MRGLEKKIEHQKQFWFMKSLSPVAARALIHSTIYIWAPFIYTKKQLMFYDSRVVFLSRIFNRSSCFPLSECLHWRWFTKLIKKFSSLSTDIELKFSYRQVSVKRGEDVKQYYELNEEIGR